MNKHKHLLHFAALLMVIWSCACGGFQDVQFKGVKDIKINSFDTKGVDAMLYVTINNPNHAAFTVYPSDLDLTLGKSKAGNAHLTNKIKIKGNAEAVYGFHLVADFANLGAADLAKIAMMALTNKLNIGLKGNINAGKFFLRKNVPVDIQENALKNVLGK